MARRRLLVTGISGFVGSVLARAVSAGDRAEMFELVGGPDMPDLRDADGVERMVAAARPDAVIHLAAVAAPRQAKEDPAAAWQVNVMGTFHLASAVMRHAPEARFVFAGSSEAYGAAFNDAGNQSGNGAAAPLREDAALEPLSPYGATKAAADIMLRQMAFDGLNAVIFRPFNHTGPGQSANYVVPAFATQIARIEAGLQEPVMKVGNLEARRDFLDVRDVVEAYLTAAGRDAGGDAEKTFNLSTGRPVAISQLLAMLTEMASVPVSVEVDPARYQPNSIPVMSGDNARAAAVLGWAPSIPLSQTLSEILERARTDARA